MIHCRSLEIYKLIFKIQNLGSHMFQLIFLKFFVLRILLVKLCTSAMTNCQIFAQKYCNNEIKENQHQVVNLSMKLIGATTKFRTRFEHERFRKVKFSIWKHGVRGHTGCPKTAWAQSWLCDSVSSSVTWR